LGGHIDVSKGLQLELGELVTNVEANRASADRSECGLGAVIIPCNWAVRACSAGRSLNGSSDVESSESLGGKGGEESGGGDGGEHGRF
jgi:hypothetical protein